LIQNFKDADTQLLWETGKSRRIPADLRTTALKKLRILHRVIQLEELKIPPGNRLEALKGKRKGQHSIRINDQFRVCFVWNQGQVYEVEIVDYH
jgi:proteic killer suppression protein